MPSPMHVLCVEDDAAQLRALSGLLSAHRHQVVPVQTVQDARDLLRSQPFDFVVCDFQLGDGRALELLEEKLLPPEKTIIISGHSNLPVPPSIPVLRKPIDFAQLLELMR